MRYNQGRHITNWPRKFSHHSVHPNNDRQYWRTMQSRNTYQKSVKPDQRSLHKSWSGISKLTHQVSEATFGTHSLFINEPRPLPSNSRRPSSISNHSTQKATLLNTHTPRKFLSDRKWQETSNSISNIISTRHQHQHQHHTTEGTTLNQTQVVDSDSKGDIRNPQFSAFKHQYQTRSGNNINSTPSNIYLSEGLNYRQTSNKSSQRHQWPLSSPTSIGLTSLRATWMWNRRHRYTNANESTSKKTSMTNGPRTRFSAHEHQRSRQETGVEAEGEGKKRSDIIGKERGIWIWI